MRSILHGEIIKKKKSITLVPKKRFTAINKESNKFKSLTASMTTLKKNSYFTASDVAALAGQNIE